MQSRMFCIKCDQTLHSRFHKCGVKEPPHKVEVFGGGNWGKMGIGGRNEHNDNK